MRLISHFLEFWPRVTLYDLFMTLPVYLNRVNPIRIISIIRIRMRLLISATRPRHHCFPLRICFHRLPRFYGSQRDLLLGFRFLKKSSRSLLPRDSDVKLLLGFQKNLLIWVASNQIRLKWLAGARELDWNCIRRQIKKRELARYYF